MRWRFTLFLSFLFLLGLVVVPEKGSAGSLKRLQGLKKPATLTLNRCEFKRSDLDDDDDVNKGKGRSGKKDEKSRKKSSRTELN